MKILFLYSHGGEIVTGGEKYEDMLYQDYKRNPEMEVERVWLNNDKGRLRKYLSPVRNLALARKLKGYDLVLFNSAHCFNFLPLIWLLKSMGIKTGIIHHHFLFHGMTGPRHTYYRWLEVGFLNGAASVIVPSPYINELCCRMFPKKEIHYWQIPFEPHPSQIPAAPVAGNLLYIGTIEPRKGLVHLLGAMSILKKRGVGCRLTIVGKTVKPDYRAMLDRKIAEDGLDVRFTGFVSDEELQRIISRADIFTFPSRLEGYGMVICESMVNGLPVVCFDNSAMPYTVKDGVNGRLVPDGDDAAMADAIASVITDRALRGELSLGALDTVANFMTREKFRHTVVNETKEIINSLMK